MAAPKIRLRRSATAGNAPTTSQIDLGEVAINTHDGKIFLKRNQSGTERIVDVTAPLEANEPMGHNDVSESSISFTNATRVFSIAPTSTRFDVWCQGIRFAFTSTQSTTIPNTNGLYYVYFDGNGVLQNKAASSADINYKTEVPTAILYWNGSVASFVFDTRHGITLDWQTHEYLQKTRGAVVASGFTALTYSTTGDGTANSHAQFGLGTDGVFYNEDYKVSISHSASPSNLFEQSITTAGEFPILYRNGTGGQWTRTTATSYPVKFSTGNLIEYNVSGASWSSAQVSSGNFGVYFIVATSDIDAPIVSIQGQGNYATEGEAMKAEFEDLDLGNDDASNAPKFPRNDVRPLFKLIFQANSTYTNAPKARLVDLIDLRQNVSVELTGAQGSSIAVTAPESNIIYVSKDGDDTNTGTTLGTAKTTIKSALSVATTGTVIRVYPGEYTEDNPLIMPAQTSIVGSSLREVTLKPQNGNTDFIYVNNGCYISDLSFNSSSSNNGDVISFNPSDPPFIDQSPYIQNCTNFIDGSTGLHIDGDDAIGDIKSMVVDSFTQFNSGGHGCKISNEGYAQLVSMFTICNDTAVECLNGGCCDLTNSNSSFGNKGLVATGVSPKKYTGTVSQASSAGDNTIRVNIATTQKSVSTATYANTTGVLTVTTSAAHGFDVGMDVKIENLTFSCTSPSGSAVFPSGNYGYVFKVESTPSTTQFTVNVGTSTIAHTYVSGGTAEIEAVRPFAGQVVFFDTLYYEVVRINVTNGGSGYDSNNPPTVTLASSPESWGIDAEAIAEVSSTGVVTGIVVTSSGRGYGSTIANPTIAAPTSGTTATATGELVPSYLIVESTLETSTDVYDITFANEVPIALTTSSVANFYKQSRLLASSHSFQYIGSGTNINTALPQTGGVSIPENETISQSGGLVVFTSTNESGNFKIGDGVIIDQALGRISGQSYSQSLFSQVTPYIIALGG